MVELGASAVCGLLAVVLLLALVVVLSLARRQRGFDLDDDEM